MFGQGVIVEHLKKYIVAMETMSSVICKYMVLDLCTQLMLFNSTFLQMCLTICPDVILMDQFPFEVSSSQVHTGVRAEEL